MTLTRSELLEERAAKRSHWIADNLLMPVMGRRLPKIGSVVSANISGPSRFHGGIVVAHGNEELKTSRYIQIEPLIQNEEAVKPNHLAYVPRYGRTFSNACSSISKVFCRKLHPIRRAVTVTIASCFVNIPIMTWFMHFMSIGGAVGNRDSFVWWFLFIAVSWTLLSALENTFRSVLDLVEYIATTSWVDLTMQVILELRNLGQSNEQITEFLLENARAVNDKVKGNAPETSD